MPSDHRKVWQCNCKPVLWRKININSVHQRKACSVMKSHSHALQVNVPVLTTCFIFAPLFFRDITGPITAYMQDWTSKRTFSSCRHIIAVRHASFLASRNACEAILELQRKPDATARPYDVFHDAYTIKVRTEKLDVLAPQVHKNVSRREKRLEAPTALKGPVSMCRSDISGNFNRKLWFTYNQPLSNSLLFM